MKKLAPLLATATLALGAGTARAADVPPAVQHLADAIRHPTISHQQAAEIDYGVFAEFRHFLANTYPAAFTRLTAETIAGHSLLLSWAGSDPALKPVLFDAHYDVVPIEAGTENDWTHPPFAGVVADGYLWGRGALDDKLTVIATLEAIEALLREGYAPRRTLLFSFGHDEEIGGKQGAAAIATRLARRDVQLEFMVGEGGVVVHGHPLLPTRPLALIGLAEKSYLTLTLTATGTGGHSSFPPRDNAAVRLAQALSALHENPFEAKLVSPVSDMLQTLAPHVGGLRGFLFENQWLSEALLLRQLAKERTGNALVRTTTAVTMIDAGVKENVVPQQARAKVNFRLLPGDTPDQVVEWVQQIIADERIEIKADSWAMPPPVADIAGEGYARIRAAIEGVVADAVVSPGLVIATTDTKHYVNLTADIYRFHPYSLHIDEAGSIHGTDERVAVATVLDAVRLSRALIESAGLP